MTEFCKKCKFKKGKQGTGKVIRCVRFPHAIDKQPYDWCGEFLRDPSMRREHQPNAAGNVRPESSYDG